MHAVGDSEVDVSLSLRTGGSSTLFQEIHILPTYQVINESRDEITLLFQPDPTSTSPQPAAFSVTVASGCTKPITMSSATGGHWCLFDPENHRLSTPFDPLRVAYPMHVKFLGGGAFKSFVVDSKVIYMQYELHVLNSSEKPPLQFRNYSDRTVVKFCQSQTALGVERTLAAGHQVSAGLDDSSVQPEYTVSVAQEEPTCT